jgi:hypothetical protein
VCLSIGVGVCVEHAKVACSKQRAKRRQQLVQATESAHESQVNKQCTLEVQDESNDGDDEVADKRHQEEHHANRKVRRHLFRRMPCARHAHPYTSEIKTRKTRRHLHDITDDMPRIMSIIICRIMRLIMRLIKRLIMRLMSWYPCT